MEVIIISLVALEEQLDVSLTLLAALTHSCSAPWGLAECPLVKDCAYSRRRTTGCKSETHSEVQEDFAGRKYWGCIQIASIWRLRDMALILEPTSKAIAYCVCNAAPLPPDHASEGCDGHILAITDCRDVRAHHAGYHKCIRQFGQQ